MEQNKDKGGYRFGIELEYRLTLRHNRDDYSDRQKIKKRLAELWNEAGNGVQGHISMIYGGPMDKAKDFKVWNVVDEDSMEGSADPLTCRCTSIQAREYQQPDGASLLQLRSDIFSWL